MKCTGSRVRRSGGPFLFLLAFGAILITPSASNAQDSLGGAECRIVGNMSVLFKPGTTELEKQAAILKLSSNSDFEPGDRWVTTHGGNTGGWGNPASISYSYVPDGTFVPNSGLGSGPSSLFARMNAQFGGNTALWQSKFDASFNRWDALTGLSHTHVNDDGAALHSAPGVGTTRGDVRIAMITMTDSNVIAYNFFPDIGDMVMNRTFNFANPTNDYRFMRNTIMHEHGHGFGLEHMMSNNSIQLMEPILMTSQDGPQNDDIQGGQYTYGDWVENNDNNATNSDLGNISNGQEVLNLAIERPADQDWFRVTVSPGVAITITATPVGAIYNEGPQGGSQQSRNSTSINNLRVSAYEPNGTTLLGTSDTGATGQPEVLTNIIPPSGEARIKIDVSTNAFDIQRYRLTFNLTTSGETVVPTSFEMFRGIVLSGGLPELQTSNNQYLAMRPGPVFSNSEYPIQLIARSTTSVHTPSQLRFSVESFVNTGNLNRKLELFNVQTQAYEQIDLQGASQTEGIVEILISSNAGRFVNSTTGAVSAKMSWMATSTTFTYPWIAKVDHIFWRLNP
ncbi:MAG: matrixin family metalloprotease [Fimbriimonadales bacterium]